MEVICDHVRQNDYMPETRVEKKLSSGRNSPKMKTTTKLSKSARKKIQAKF